MDLDFDRSAPAQSGILIPVAPGIRRIIANNPSPFTFTGTCTYVVGRGDVTVIDPGPEDEQQIDALLAGLPGERVARILITHTHRDHSPAARQLQARTGAPIIGCGPHRASRAALTGEVRRLDASSDPDHAPDRILVDGDVLEGEDHAFRVIETPGHTANHLAFELVDTGMLFSGDHVMAWSTSIVAPPDGAMGPYLASLEKLIAREEDRAYWPGHGGPVVDPRRFTRALLSHRRQRETQIIEFLAKGPARIPAMVAANYPGLNPALVGAAGLSVFAHIEDLIGRGVVNTEGDATLESQFVLL
ncbi:MAG: beta-lactamase domain-containing [Beijerinckiaceae bacterium]|nr:MAG: beta-lactamase domain-containing [Beijerinckiaceae bacterium]